MFPFRVIVVVLVTAIISNRGLGHEFTERGVLIACDLAEIGATVTAPEHAETSKDACVVLVGGTLSQTRDGGFRREGAPNRDAMKRLAQALALKGYSSIRYDKVGFGKTKALHGWEGTYLNESQLAEAVIEYAREQVHGNKVVVAGESAGAYLACLAAKRGVQADAYLFLGGHCDSGPAIYEYNFARLVRLANSSPEWKEFAVNGHQSELALGRTYHEMFDAASTGDSTYEISDGDFKQTVGTTRRKEELDMPPDEMFRFIKSPALALSGEYDLNVPPDHAARIVSILRNSGNHNCTCVLVPGCDHSFQLSPADEQQRLRERYSLESFNRAYSPQLYREIVTWLDDTLGFAPSSKLPANVEAGELTVRATEQSEIDSKTEFTPERLYLAPGIQIIENITDKRQTTGVATLEGEIGPLLLGNDCQAHFIDMPAGMYCEEHPHSNESIIFTVRGQWVLCSAGRRQVMKPGTLFHFAPNTPTGYEIPFSENALILIFKGQRLTKKEEDFINYLRGMAKRLEQEHEAGVPYLLSDLPADHPAIKFAKTVNPDYGKALDTVPAIKTHQSAVRHP
ncbi:MAG: alpha/beta hydrolase [Planctomycetales bacterium]|nr:alpha/beta hydrolase [Planctomycetales bacterium]